MKTANFWPLSLKWILYRATANAQKLIIKTIFKNFFLLSRIIFLQVQTLNIKFSNTKRISRCVGYSTQLLPEENKTNRKNNGAPCTKSFNILLPRRERSCWVLGLTSHSFHQISPRNCSSEQRTLDLHNCHLQHKTALSANMSITHQGLGLYTLKQLQHNTTSSEISYLNSNKLLISHITIYCFYQVT